MDETVEVTVEDERACVERFIFVVSFEGVTDSGLDDSVQLSIDMEDYRIQTQRTDPDEDEDAYATSSKNACVEYTQLDQPTIYLEAGRTIEITDLKKYDPDDTAAVEIDDDWSFSKQTPIEVEFTVTDSWQTDYQFDLDTINQSWDVENETYTSKYMDIRVSLTNDITGAEIPLPDGTKVTIYNPYTSNDAQTFTLTSVNVFRDYYTITTSGDTNAYSFQTIFENATGTSEVMNLRVLIDFSESVLFDSSFADDQYKLVVAAKRTSDPSLPNGDTIVSVSETIKLERQTDYGLKLSANGLGDLIVQDATDTIKFNTAYEGERVDEETLSAELQYAIYQETDYEILNGLIYNTVYELVSWSDLGIALEGDYTTDGKYLVLDVLENMINADDNSLVMTGESGVLSDLPDGNYKIVCSFVVNGATEATDFIIFNVNTDLSPQLEIPDQITE